jgi:hypothetical protein
VNDNSRRRRRRHEIKTSDITIFVPTLQGDADDFRSKVEAINDEYWPTLFEYIDEF